MNFIRLKFIGILIIGSIALVGCKQNQTNVEGEKSVVDTKELSFGHGLPPDHRAVENVTSPLVDEIFDATEGRIKIEEYPAETLASEDSLYDAAVTGGSDISEGMQSYSPGQFKLTSILDLPLDIESGEMGSEILWTLYEEFPEMQEEYNETVPISLYTAAPGQLFTVGKQVKTLEDLKGLSIRSPSSIGNEWLTAAGANAVSMPFQDVFEALERGVIDGFISATNIPLDYPDYADIIDYVTMGNFYVIPFFTVMNKKSWDSINSEDQKIIMDLTGMKYAKNIGKTYDASALETIETYDGKKLEFYTIPDNEMNKWKEELFNPLIQEWISEMESEGLPGQEIYDRTVELRGELKQK